MKTQDINGNGTKPNTNDTADANICMSAPMIKAMVKVAMDNCPTTVTPPLYFTGDDWASGAY